MIRNPKDDSIAVAKENLKAIKVLHQVLMAVTAAILAFALRSDMSQQYRDALNEIAGLRQISLGGWSNYVAQRYKSETKDNETFILGTIRQAGVNLRGNPSVEFPVFAEQVPPLDSPLLNLDTFFSKSQTIGVMKLGGRKSLLDQLSTWAKARTPRGPIIAVNPSMTSGGVQYPSGSPMVNWVSRSQPTTSSVPIYLVTDQPGGQAEYINLTYSIQSNTGRYALDWLKNDTFGQHLVDAKSGTVFPHLKPFWHQINQDNVEQAAVFLQEQLEANSRGTLLFFGIPVERSLAILAGPFLSFSVLIFLGMHLRHFRSLTPEVARTYPWVALFQNPLSTIATYLTLLVLPLLANAALLYRYGHRAEISTLMGIVATCTIAPIGAWVLFDIHKVRRASTILPEASNDSPISAPKVTAAPKER